MLGLETALKTAFSNLSCFSSLTELELKFQSFNRPLELNNGATSYSELPRVHIEQQLISQFTSHPIPPGITSFRLKNLTPIPNTFLNFNHFQNLMHSIKKLEITYISASFEGNSSNGFWLCNVCKDMLRAATSITHLSLGTHNGVDIDDDGHSAHVPPYDTIACDDIYFQHLTHLTFNGVVFGLDVATEGFILRHKETLTHLTLQNCMVYDETNRWANVWRDLEVEMISLISLKVSHYLSDEGVSLDYISAFGEVFSGISELDDYEDDIAFADLEIAVDRRRT